MRCPVRLHIGVFIVIGLSASYQVASQASVELSTSLPNVQTSPCAVNLTVGKDKYAIYDLSLLQKWSPWKYSFGPKDSKPRQSLEINFCGGPPGPTKSWDPCMNSSVCLIEGNKRTPFSTWSRDLRHQIFFSASGLHLSYSCYTCGTHEVKLNIVLYCGRHLSYPRLIWSSEFTKMFEWTTSAACLVPPPRKEVPCSTYNADGQLFDLTSLIKTKGGYEVETLEDDDEEFVINVCSNLNPDGNIDTCPDGSAACFKNGKEAFGAGRLQSRLSFNNGNLQLVYEEPDSEKRIPGCISPAKTVINFRCPNTRAQARPPRLVSSTDCYYEVEWETDHACPLSSSKGNLSTCSFSREAHGVDIDLSPLRKTNGDAPYSIVADLYQNETRYEFLLNICGGIPSQHECNPGWKSTAVCLRKDGTEKGVLLCQTKGSQLKYADGEITLTYQGTTSCPKSNQGPTSVVINFTCNETAENNGIGSGRFLYEEECTFFFDWPTKHACPKTPENVCYFSHGPTQFNLASISTATSWFLWNVEDSLAGQGQSREIYLNFCGDPDLLVGKKCPKGALVCLLANQTSLNLGSIMSEPVYNEATKKVDVVFKSGDVCYPGVKRQTKLSITCTPGQITSSPKLVHLSECQAELEWNSASACPMTVSPGYECKVYDANLGLVIDLSPLESRSSYQMEAFGYMYHINICSPVKVKGCPSTAGGCQREIKDGTERRAFSLGVATSNLTYRDGLVSLVYKGGEPYNNPARTPRSMTIAFLCDREVGLGVPIFEGEAERAYTFRWDTSYACPKEASVNCMILDPNTHRQYDLSSLTKTWDNWEVMDAEGKRKFFMNVCHPINRVDSCHSQSAACAVSIENGQMVAPVSLGQALTLPEIASDGHLILRYSVGDSCIAYGVKTTYSVTINFICHKGSSTEGPKFLGILGTCQFSFLWATEAACAIGAEMEKECRFQDSVTGITYDLKPLIKNNSFYEVNTGDRKFQLNICGAVGKDGCPQAKGGSESVAACELNLDGKSTKTVLGVADSRMLHSFANGPIRLTYIGDHESIGNPNDKVFFTHTDIRFQCSKNGNDLRFLKQENETYFFEFSTPLVCVPEPVDCDVVDEKGLEYNLNSLTSNGTSDWIVHDSSVSKFHLSFCNPLTGLGGLACHGAGICQMASKGEFFSLGVQQTPRVVANGSILIEYKNGSLCPGYRTRLSAKVFLHCSSMQGQPRLLEVSPECNYMFSLHTPAACPIKVFKGENCQVKDKIYGYKFDLSPLRNATSNYKVKFGQYTYLLNVCGALKNGPGNCQDSAICQTKEKDSSFVVSAGKPSQELTLRDGLIQLVYSNGKANCHAQYNRSTILSFVCDYSTDGIDSGPRFISEEEDCTYIFQWATRYACPPHAGVSCYTRGPKGEAYDLSALSWSGNNYHVLYPEKNQMKFLLNVCRNLVYQKDQLCPYSSAACLLNVSDPNPTTKATNIGESLSGPEVVDGKLLIRYTHGSPCPTDKKSYLQTVIEFQCDSFTQFGQAEFISLDACTYNFLWRTSSACPISDQATTSGHCTTTNPATGYVFNLTSLAKDIGYKVENEGDEFILNVCSDLKNSHCSSGVGTCQTKPGTPKISVSAGKTNGDLYYSHGTLYLNYTDGEKCPGGLDERSTFITFECSLVDKGPVFLSEADDCTFYFNWDTPLACEHGIKEEEVPTDQVQVPCVVRTPNGTLDLSPLMQKNNAFQALDVNRHIGIYGVSICKSLTNFNPIGLINAAAVCSLCFGTTKPMSLGTLEKPPYMDSEGKNMIDYVNGSICPFNPNKRLSTKVTFVCDYSNDETLEIIDVNEDSCTVFFELNTALACSGPMAPSLCTFSDHESGFQMDLSALSNMGHPFAVKNLSSTYLLGICDVVKQEGACRGAGVCRVTGAKEDNLGLVGKTSFFHNGVHLTMIYETNENCPQGDSEKVRSEIKFYCHPTAGTGKPQLYKSTNCVTVFLWMTSAVCHLDHPPCTLFASNRLFDLRELASISHSWSAPTQDFMYWLNICKEVHSETVFKTHNVSCSPYASVCQVSQDKSTKMLGNVLTQKLIYREKSKELVLRYDYGDETVCPKTNLTDVLKASAEIVFTCSNQIGKPTFDSGPDDRCVYHFSWKSSAACPGVNVSLISEVNGLLVDKRLEGNYFINISGLFNRTFDVKEVNREADDFSYVINLNQGVGGNVEHPECVAASICQKKSDGSFYRDIGTVGSHKFYLRGTELRMVITSHGRKCGKNKSKNVTSIINFQCATEPGVGVPEFLYENNNCDYYFEWITNAVCPQSPNRQGFFGGVHVDYQPEVSAHESETLSIPSIIGIVLLLLTGVLLILVLARRERRSYLKTKVKGFFHSFRLPCYTYTDFQCYFLRGGGSPSSQGDGEAVLLAPHETFHKGNDDSDSDPIA